MRILPAETAARKTGPVPEIVSGSTGLPAVMRGPAPSAHPKTKARIAVTAATKADIVPAPIPAPGTTGASGRPAPKRAFVRPIRMKISLVEIVARRFGPVTPNATGVIGASVRKKAAVHPIQPKQRVRPAGIVVPGSEPVSVTLHANGPNGGNGVHAAKTRPAVPTRKKNSPS